MIKYVAMAFHPWGHLEASHRLAAEPAPWAGNMTPLRVRPGNGMGLGFLTVYGSRVEAEAANPGVAVLEIEEEQR